MLVIDEASRVSDEMYEALRPMLAVGDGDLWMLSTPRGKSGFFYETWEHGGSGMAAGARAGDGVPADFEEVSGRAAAGDGGG